MNCLCWFWHRWRKVVAETHGVSFRQCKRCGHTESVGEFSTAAFKQWRKIDAEEY